MKNSTVNKSRKIPRSTFKMGGNSMLSEGNVKILNTEEENKKKNIQNSNFLNDSSMSKTE